MFEGEIEELERMGLLRRILSRESCQGTEITLGGRRYLNFSSNDYLGLSGHPDIIRSAKDALGRFGFGAGASRLLAGGSLLHRELEESVAIFKGTESAVVLNSGYAANTGIIPAIAAEGDAIFSDALNHASIIDGCRLSRAKIVIYRHRDMAHLNRLIRTERARRKVIITDTVFSMDGDIAPLDKLYEISCGSASGKPQGPSRRGGPNSVLLYLDDAHGTGVLGNGRGALAQFGIKPEPWILQIGTFSKALGAFGAFAAGSSDVIQWISNTCRSLVFSTALPDAVVAACAAAITLVKRHPGRIRRLWRNRQYLAEGLRSAGFDTMTSSTPIIPVLTSDIKEALGLSTFLLEKGVYVPAIRPPSVEKARVRITVSAVHTKRQINFLLKAMEEFRRKD